MTHGATGDPMGNPTADSSLPIQVDEYPTSRRSLRIAVVTETYPPEINGVAATIASFVEGLRARNRLNSSGENETSFLAPLQKIASSGKTPAEIKLDRFHQAWAGSVDPAFSEFAY